MRGKGINYDTGTFPDGMNTRELFDAGTVRREMRVIADELHCTPGKPGLPRKAADRPRSAPITQFLRSAP